MAKVKSSYSGLCFLPWEGVGLVLSQKFFYLLYWEWQKILKAFDNSLIFYDPYVRILTVFLQCTGSFQYHQCLLSQRGGSAFPDCLNHFSTNSVNSFVKHSLNSAVCTIFALRMVEPFRVKLIFMTSVFHL